MQIPSLFFPRSLSFDLAEIQKLLIEYESIIELHAKTSAVDAVVVDENCVVSEITGRADKIIRGRTFSATSLRDSVFRLQHGNLDQAVYKKIEDFKQELENISHVVSVFKGEQPGSITAASAISQLRGQAELMFAKPVQNWANLWKETVRKGIKNYQRHWSVPEIAEIVGVDKVAEIEEFKAANLDKCLEFTSTNAGLPKTRDEQRQEMMVLFDKGALDVTDSNVRQKVFELFGETGMMKTFNDDARRARLNVRMIRSGQPMMFRSGIDDPNVHLGIALEAAKALDFDKWEPPIQNLLYTYISEVQAAQALLLQPEPEGEPSGSPDSPKKAPPAGA